MDVSNILVRNLLSTRRMSSPYEIDITNRQTQYTVPGELFHKAVAAVFAGEGYARGEVGIAVVDNPEIQQSSTNASCSMTTRPT